MGLLGVAARRGERRWEGWIEFGLLGCGCPTRRRGRDLFDGGYGGGEGRGVAAGVGVGAGAEQRHRRDMMWCSAVRCGRCGMSVRSCVVESRALGGATLPGRALFARPRPRPRPHNCLSGRYLGIGCRLAVSPSCPACRPPAAQTHARLWLPCASPLQCSVALQTIAHPGRTVHRYITVYSAAHSTASNCRALRPLTLTLTLPPSLSRPPSVRPPTSRSFGSAPHLRIFLSTPKLSRRATFSRRRISPSLDTPTLTRAP